MALYWPHVQALAHTVSERLMHRSDLSFILSTCAVLMEMITLQVSSKLVPMQENPAHSKVHL